MAQTREAFGPRCASGHGRRFTEGLLDNNSVLKALNLHPGQTVVDAGCGNGYMSRLFSKEVGDSGTVYAVDLNPGNIACLGKDAANTNIRAFVCDITQIPIKSASVDLVYMSTVIHSQPKEKLRELVQELRRVLREDGVFAVVEIDKRETPFGPPLRQRYSPEELREAVPLEPIKTVPIGDYFYLQLFRVRCSG